MTSKHRLIIKIAFIALFIILAPLVIAYTMGYRYNFSANQIQKTGVLIVNSYPDEAAIFLDGKLINDQTPAVVKKILPNPYDVEVKKENYLTWSKNLEVKSAQSTFAENIVLFLDSQPRLLAEREIINPVFSPDQTSVAYLTEETGWVEIWLYEFKNDDFNLVDRRPKETVTDIDTQWSTGSRNIYIEITGPETTEQVIYENNGRKLINLKDFFENPVNNFKWSRTSDDVFYTLENSKLYAYNIITGQKTFLLNGVDEYFVRGNKIFLITNADDKILVEEYDILDPQAEITSLYELAAGKYAFEDASYPYILIKKDDRELLLFDTSAPFAEPILDEEASGFSWYTTSNGERRLLYYKDFEIFIFYPQDKYNELITRAGKEIKNALWHRFGTYIFYALNDEIKVIELDSREKRNIFDLVSGADLNDFSTDYNSKNLYFIGKIENSYGIYQYPLLDK